MQQQQYQPQQYPQQQYPPQQQTVQVVTTTGLNTNVNQHYYHKRTPVAFWVLLVLGIIQLISGISNAASGNMPAVPSILITAAILLLTAFTIRHLEIKGHADHIYLGFGPFQICNCCFQSYNLYYSNVQCYYERYNKCHYPVGYQPGYWSPNGDDCCINTFFRGYCCCTNTFFYNSACIFCCCVDVRDLIVFKLREPIHCCCHTLDHIAVSVYNNKTLSNYLMSRGLQNASNGGVMLQVNTTTTTVQTPQQQQYQPQIQMQGQVQMQSPQQMQYQQHPQQQQQQMQQQPQYNPNYVNEGNNNNNNNNSGYPNMQTNEGQQGQQTNY